MVDPDAEINGGHGTTAYALCGAPVHLWRDLPFTPDAPGVHDPLRPGRSCGARRGLTSWRTRARVTPSSCGRSPLIGLGSAGVVRLARAICAEARHFPCALEGQRLMAKQTITRLTDDLDGTEAEATVRFGWEGVAYEIDLTAEHAAAFAAAIQPYRDAARPVGPVRAGRASRCGWLATSPVGGRVGCHPCLGSRRRTPCRRSGPYRCHADRCLPFRTATGLPYRHRDVGKACDDVRGAQDTHQESGQEGAGEEDFREEGRLEPHGQASGEEDTRPEAGCEQRNRAPILTLVRPVGLSR